MKLFNKALCLVALFAISEVSAKPMKGRAIYTGEGAPTYTGEGAPTKEKQEQKPTIMPLSEKIKEWRGKSGLANVSGHRVVFSDQFLASTQKYIQDAQLGKDMFKYMLQLNRDAYGKFTGNDAKDLVILNDSNEQIAYLVGQFGDINQQGYADFLKKGEKDFKDNLNNAK